jgi:uncharacterized protein (TIGR02246 family)
MTAALDWTPAQADETAVRALFQCLLDAWGRGDGPAYGALFTDAADYVAFDGSRTVGRRAIAESHQRLFDTWLHGTRLTGRIEGLRWLAPDVALVHATGGTIFAGEAAPRPSRDSIQTLVAVMRDGEWRFAAFPDLERALTAFESHRRPRVEKLVREGRRQGRRKAAANPLSRRVRDLMLPFMLELGARSLRNVHDYRVDWRDRAA